MRWRGRRRSRNVEDRRGVRVRRGGGLGLGGLLLALVAVYFGMDPRVALELGGLAGGAGGTPVQLPDRPTPQEEELAQFVAVVLADTEDVWHSLFRQMGRRYEEPVLVLFSGAVESACGLAGAASGPFYCPGDRKIYIDLSFYDELRERFGAPGDLAQAYVIAHEVGHHVQHLLGYAARVPRGSKGAGSAAVRLELQADCLAGLWVAQTERARGILEAGDIDEALNAASAIGDDRLQRRATGRVHPDGFTHGTSEQRRRWLHRGMQAATLEECDTFEARTP